MYSLTESKKYAKSLYKLQRSGRYTVAVKNDIKLVIRYLLQGTPLPVSFSDHRLKGEYVSYRECHIKGDLLLMYRKNEGARLIVLHDIGTHSQLFG